MRDWFYYYWYELTYLAMNMTCTLGFSLKTEGRNNIPKAGGALVLANHASYLDPVLVGLATRRHLIPLARKSLWKNPILRVFIDALQAVPIDRESGGKEGLKNILERLNRGQAILLFPEGTRTKTGELSPFRPGVHLLIKRTKLPIIPVGIAGGFQAWPTGQALPKFAPLFLPTVKASIAVSVGRPLDGNKYASMTKEAALQQLSVHVKSMYDRAEELRRR
ncbi:MAG: lysophospholipid acyltransferase family protein [Gemmataceae bacterium]